MGGCYRGGLKASAPNFSLIVTAFNGALGANPQVLTRCQPQRQRPADAERDWMAQPVMHHFARAYLPATANKASGLVRAIVSNVRAAPLGCLRPCSHP